MNLLWNDSEIQMVVYKTRLKMNEKHKSQGTYLSDNMRKCIKIFFFVRFVSYIWVCTTHLSLRHLSVLISITFLSGFNCFGWKCKIRTKMARTRFKRDFERDSARFKMSAPISERRTSQKEQKKTKKTTAVSSNWNVSKMMSISKYIRIKAIVKHAVQHSKSRYFSSESNISFLDRNNGRKLAYKICTTEDMSMTKPGLIFCPGFQANMQGVKALALEEYCRERDMGFVRYPFLILLGGGGSPGRGRGQGPSFGP